ncbi:MAG TPA: RlmE family RNA methyltransferase, partial [Thermodesulfobacteriota bacterium]|nr:RlmE family RNA methyltransferase [Thermodesulfobacteriota bacterium]
MDRRDPFYRRAKREGYRSRAAYKLAELDARHRLLRPGARVLDLGCAPGGWLQVAAERVGPEGRVVGLDLAPVAPLPEPNVVVIRGDLRDPAALAAAAQALAGPADVVLSDLSPKLSGVRATDIARSLELLEAAAEAARRLLRTGGSLVAKVFTAPETADWIARLRPAFARVAVETPQATRKGSTETYVVATGFRRPPA